MRRAGRGVPIAVQPTDATTGAHLWADRFDGSLEDVFDLQDKVASSVAGVIEPTLRAAEVPRSSERPTSDLNAYEDSRSEPAELFEGEDRLTRSFADQGHDA